jgi:hypothetical protein
MAVRLSVLRTGRALLPRNIICFASGTHFSYRLSKPQGLVWPEELGKFKENHSAQEKIYLSNLTSYMMLRHFVLLAYAWISAYLGGTLHFEIGFMKEVDEKRIRRVIV